MSRTAWMITVLTGLVFGVLAVRFHAQRERARLRAAIAVEARRASEVGTTNVEVAPAAAVLGDDRKAIAGLRREIDELKRRAEERARARAAEDEARRSAPQVAGKEQSLLDEMVPAEAWRNRGRATPADTLETALWAVAGGDVTALTKLLRLTPAARSKAETCCHSCRIRFARSVRRRRSWWRCWRRTMCRWGRR